MMNNDIHLTIKRQPFGINCPHHIIISYISR